MHSDMIGKIEKARQYAEEPDRIEIFSLTANFRGSNGTYHLSLADGAWQCDSPSFLSHGISAHIIAMQKVLDVMLPEAAREPLDPSGVQMHSEMIGKIEKARRYADEPERIEITQIAVKFRGTNSNHIVSLQDGQWQCDCAFFRSRNTCQHIMAVQRVLNVMLTPDARQPELDTALSSEMVSV